MPASHPSIASTARAGRGSTNEAPNGETCGPLTTTTPQRVLCQDSCASGMLPPELFESARDLGHRRRQLPRRTTTTTPREPTRATGNVDFNTLRILTSCRRKSSGQGNLRGPDAVVSRPFEHKLRHFGLVPWISEVDQKSSRNHSALWASKVRVAKRAIDARTWSAVLVQRKGFGSSLWA